MAAARTARRRRDRRTRAPRTFAPVRTPYATRRTSPRTHGVSLDKTVCKNDPVDIATGKMLLPQTDLALPGVLPWSFDARTYRPTATVTGSGGAGHPPRREDRVRRGRCRGHLGPRGWLAAHLPPPARGGRRARHALEGDRLPLFAGGVTDNDTSYEIHDPHSGQVRVFTGNPYRTSAASWLLGDRGPQRQPHVLLAQARRGSDRRVPLGRLRRADIGRRLAGHGPCRPRSSGTCGGRGLRIRHLGRPDGPDRSRGPGRTGHAIHL